MKKRQNPQCFCEAKPTTTKQNKKKKVINSGPLKLPALKEKIFHLILLFKYILISIYIYFQREPFSIATSPIHK